MISSNLHGGFSDWQAYYNWAIAISDRAKIRGRTKEAEELWKQVHKLSHSKIYFSVCPTSLQIGTQDLINITSCVQACDRYDRSVQLNWNSPQVDFRLASISPVQFITISLFSLTSLSVSIKLMWR